MIETLLIGLLILLLISLAIVSTKLYTLTTMKINRCSKHLVGKVVVVTGGNSGIGYETAKDLAARGARVIIGSIDPPLGATARNEIVKETDNEDVHYRYLDLSSFASVREFAEKIIRTETRLDILINNAGVIDTKKVITVINYFGPFLLTNLLLPLLRSSAPSRIINVASEAYRWGSIDFDNLNMEKSFSVSSMYSNSKLCVVMMTVEMSRRLKGTGVTVNALHPGCVRTPIVPKLLNDLKWMKIIKILLYFTRDCWEGAQTSIYLSVSPEVEGISGEYFSNYKIQKMTDQAKNIEACKKLWAVSEKIVKLA